MCVVTKNSNEGTQIRGIPMALAMSCWVGGREKGWGPLPLSLFFSLLLQLILLLMRCSHLKGFKFDPMPPTVTTVYLKNSCLEEAACGDLLTVFPHIILNSVILHTQTWSTSLSPQKDEEMVSHIVGLSARFACQLHFQNVLIKRKCVCWALISHM